VHHDHLSTSVCVDSHAHQCFSEFQARASIPIIFDNLNPILLNNFIEWLDRQHLPCFKEWIIIIVIFLLDLIEFMKFQLFGELEPDLLLILLFFCLDIWHLKKLFISGFIKGPLVLLVGLPGEPLTSTGLKRSSTSQS
jgi:hypothetical protein